MYQMIKSYYDLGLYTNDNLALFVSVKYITQEQADKIINNK